METCTAGSASGLGKRTSSNAGTAPQADSTLPALGAYRPPMSGASGHRVSSPTRDNPGISHRSARFVKRSRSRRDAVLVVRDVAVGELVEQVGIQQVLLAVGDQGSGRGLLGS